MDSKKKAKTKRERDDDDSSSSYEHVPKSRVKSDRRQVKSTKPAEPVIKESKPDPKPKDVLVKELPK